MIGFGMNGERVRTSFAFKLSFQLLTTITSTVYLPQPLNFSVCYKFTTSEPLELPVDGCV